MECRPNKILVARGRAAVDICYQVVDDGRSLLVLCEVAVVVNTEFMMTKQGGILTPNSRYHKALGADEDSQKARAEAKAQSS